MDVATGNCVGSDCIARPVSGHHRVHCRSVRVSDTALAGGLVVEAMTKTPRRYWNRAARMSGMTTCGTSLPHATSRTSEKRRNLKPLLISRCPLIGRPPIRPAVGRQRV